MENLSGHYYRYLRYIQAKDDTTATPYDRCMALSYAVRAQMVDTWIDTQHRYHEENPRRIYYISTEYVFGKSLKSNIISFKLDQSVLEASENLGFSMDQLYDQEDDFELGNGFKGRQSACIQESMAALGIPGMGYGIRYDYGLFKQQIRDGMQNEVPNDWLNKGHPWEVKRPEYICKVGFSGTIANDETGRQIWTPSDFVTAVPYDFPVPGYGNKSVNTVRFWAAQAPEEFLPDYHNHKDYTRACEDRSNTGGITKYLYPDEDVRRATEMRIRQQYFLVASALRDIMRRYKQHNNDITAFHEKVCIHLDGSRTAIAIAELMRILIDEENLDWETAWDITRNSFTFTCHASSIESLEKWPVYLLEEIIPRHTFIIYEINQRHLDALRNVSVPDEEIRELSIIEEGEVKWVRLANLAFVASYVTSGYSKAQTEMLNEQLFPQFTKYVIQPARAFTAGVSFRRWLLVGNRPLTGLINDAIGDGWINNPDKLTDLERFADDQEFLDRLSDIKHQAKRYMIKHLSDSCGLVIPSDAFYDMHLQRIHPSRRQILHLMSIVAQYLKIKAGEEPLFERAHIFGGRAAPSDFLAKQIVHLVNVIADAINSDPAAKNHISVHYLPNYGISMAEYVMPACDLSEQILSVCHASSATGTVKFGINGALSVCSRNGYNLEVAEHIGEEKLFLFGADCSQVKEITEYSPWKIANENPEIAAVFSFIEQLLPSVPDGHQIYPLLSSLRDNDQHRVLLDFDDYLVAKDRIYDIYRDRNRWLSTCVRTIARSGWFSTDRLVKEYAEKAWNIKRQ